MWAAVSDLGDAAMTLPLAVACIVWLTRSSVGRHGAAAWALMLAAGMALVGVTKLLYAGCGIQIRAIDFRVISGHTMLASAVWPMACAIALAGCAPIRPSTSLSLGLALGALIGVARVFDDAHTPSEVVAGWIVGSVVVLSFVRRHGAPRIDARYRMLAAGSLIAVSAAAYGRHAPIQAAIELYSPFLCGRYAMPH
ncbi:MULTISPECIES: phosphatase PAP2 family protein [Burkholderia]|jgi:membrane-associated phospholipid phosphatase|uniref:Phosphatase PAP2 family protein n=2 Tax=Burkholderia contaminans TaxID=488447 RepID=A0A1E3FIM4_9BURK|nr:MULTISPECIES: phosphatase PAP2 family protein [Burkholderia]UTP27459.1 phosphatase PAP2 family protein [Burkholderia sp. FXe9]KKL42098.1 phosphoesterase [Burkholderia contaminans LMG 23361]MBA9829959.1 phosphatase PAP2 family protein [Burkholderia contaminans]MBA9837041.1 phosphatase PAP2 family protein [Burkholderia contaminans]MBA9861671.1 phosphatase PAP2 family protein [Burkholderia contaminans]